MSRRQKRSKHQERQGGSAAVSPNEQTPGRSQYGEAHLLGSWLYWSCPDGELVTGTSRKTCRRQPRLLLEQGITLDRASGFGKEKPDLQDGYCGMGDQHPRRNVFASAVRALVSGLAVATARLLVLVNAHMRMRSRQRLSVDTLRPHLQAEHGLDVLASLGHPITGMRLELHRVRVTAFDLVTHDPAHGVAQWLG